MFAQTGFSRTGEEVPQVAQAHMVAKDNITGPGQAWNVLRRLKKRREDQALLSCSNGTRVVLLTL